MEVKKLTSLPKSLVMLNRSKKFKTNARALGVWTKDKTVKSSYKDIEIPNYTLVDYVWQNLDKWPERTVSVCASTGRGYTYEQAFKLSNAFAANLRRKFSIRDGDIVAVMLPNIPDFPLIASGILEAGGVITTLNPVYSVHEVKRQLEMCKPKLIVTLPETTNVIKQAINQAKLDAKIIVVKTNGDAVPEGTILFNELSEDVHVDTSCLKEVRRTVNDICFLPYSSGTTGLPKGVELLHRNIIANCEQINDVNIRAHNDTTASHQDSVMSVLPFFHIYGAVVVMFHKMSVGAKLVTLPKFQSKHFLESLEKHKCNSLFAAPPVVLMMTSQANSKTLNSLESVICGAAPFAVTDVQNFFKTAGRKMDFRQGYGLTETSPVATLGPRGFEDYASVGHPLPSTEVKIVDLNLNTLGPNETGEILIKGPQVMRGYKDNPQANAETFDGEWFRTGDLGFINETGVLTIADRLKELIKVSGFQVPPAELEGILRSHPSVADAAVIGVAHPTTQEAPKGFVVLKPGANPPVEEIKSFVSEKVAPYKKLQDIVFIEEIPKSAAGKILRRELKKKYC